MARIWVQRSRLLLESTISCPLGRVSLAGYIRNSKGVPLAKMRNYDSFALVYVLDGGGRMKVGSQPIFQCSSGDLLFLYPGVPHGYGPGSGERWSELYLVFSGPIFDFWRQRGLLNPSHAKQRLTPVSKWLPQLEAVVTPDLASTSEGMLGRVCRLQKFLADIIQEPEPERSELPWLERAMNELVESTRTSPVALAKKLGLSYETFRKEFTRQTGCPPARYRMRRLIEQAGVLIRERHLSNKELAETLGFCDEFHFSRRFREVTGKSPREFRLAQ